MEIKIKTIHFEAGEKLQDYIQKRVMKLERFSADIRKVEVSLKVTKPETSMNKSAALSLALPGDELFVEKIGDSFEEAVDLCVESLTRQLEKYKDKQRNAKK